MAAATAIYVNPDMWYLSILGVEPTQQRQGLGSIVLAPTLAEADALGKSCYLETFSDNLGFYQKLGFVSVAKIDDPVTKASYYVMVRQPRSEPTNISTS